VTKPKLESHQLSIRIQESVAQELETDPGLDPKELFIKYLLVELDKLYDRFYNLSEHVARQEYLSHKKKDK
jgi:hypothetical protein